MTPAPRNRIRMVYSQRCKRWARSRDTALPGVLDAGPQVLRPDPVIAATVARSSGAVPMTQDHR
jgi:hypothetical protein